VRTAAQPPADSHRPQSSMRCNPAARATPEPGPRAAWRPCQQPVDFLLERIKLRHRREAPIDRRLVAGHGSSDRVMQPRPAMDLALRQALDEVQPTKFQPTAPPRPPRSSARSALTSRGSAGPLDDPQVAHISAAQVAQFSAGADSADQIRQWCGESPTSQPRTSPLH
jgi:hypothetical protein